MKCYESCIIGVFIGALLLSLLMLNFPKHQTCEVNLGGQRISYVKLGVWND